MNEKLIEDIRAIGLVYKENNDGSVIIEGDNWIMEHDFGSFWLFSFDGFDYSLIDEYESFDQAYKATRNL